MKPSYEELESQLAASIAAERVWETTMMQACGEDGPKSVTDKFAALEKKLAESQREFRAANATIENLQMQLNAEREAKLALAAENAELKEACGGDGSYRDCPACAHSEYIEAPDTPATDAFLDEVRAQGVEMFAAWNDKHIKKGVEHKESLTAVSHAARGLAAQIRKGVHS